MLDFRPFNKVREWGNIPGDPRSVSLNVSYHKEQEYLSFVFRSLKGF